MKSCIQKIRKLWRYKDLTGEKMSQYKQFVYVVLTLITFIFMFRYDVTDPTPNNATYRLDRWSGEVAICPVNCFGWF